MENTPLLAGLVEYMQQAVHPLHIPAHQGGHNMDPEWKDWFQRNLWNMDLTEVPGLDDLHAPQGIIAEAQKRAAQVFGADQSLFLVQGATVGIQAMIMATTGPGETLVLPRYAHRSALSAMILTGAKPRYLKGIYHREGGFPLAVTVEETAQALKDSPEGFLAVHTPYFGAASDMESIGELCRQAGTTFMADEAHGSTFAFHEQLPVSALRAGAAYTVQSAHKGLGSMGQTALLHVGRNGDGDGVRKALEILQTTSPSYPLMASLDLARWQFEDKGKELLDRALELAEWARKKINACKGFRCIGEEILLESGVFALDPTKLTILTPYGLSGYEVAQRLWETHKVQVEVVGPRYLVALVTVGTRRESLEAFVQGLQEMDKLPQVFDGPGPGVSEELLMAVEVDVALSPREAYFAQKRRVSWQEAIGQIGGETVTPYPPGIPLVSQGERITKEIVEIFQCYWSLGAGWQGLSDETGKTVQIIDK